MYDLRLGFLERLVPQFGSEKRKSSEFCGGGGSVEGERDVVLERGVAGARLWERVVLMGTEGKRRKRRLLHVRRAAFIKKRRRREEVDNSTGYFI